MVTSSNSDPDRQLENLLPNANPRPLGDPERLRLGVRTYSPGEIEAALAPQLTEARMERIDGVVRNRTQSVAVVVEGIANIGNVSAVMRSAEALGNLAFHIVLGEARYKTSPRTTQGAEKWLDLYTWENPGDCTAFLHENGYRILATHLDAARPLETCSFSEGKTALVFGNEREGISPEMLALSDDRVVVPMLGFTQSFNISVAAAVTLYHVYRDRKSNLGGQGDLTSGERAVLRADYFLRSVGSAEAILRRTYGEKS